MSFSPQHPAQAQVVILPLSQLLGRSVAAVVLPGCDEVRLTVSPEPPGMWTPAQRELLGLPTREQLAAAVRASWQYALQFPRVDVLWRLSEGGEHLMSSGLVQALRLSQAFELLADPSVLRAITPQPGFMPSPTGDALPLTRLSSSAYEDLRRCPYRFFALRQLKLQESDELDTELDKRDFGNWLHHLLKLFHEALNKAPALELIARVAMINVAAEQATAELGLSQSEFLPFAAAWPRVRAGYLQWLAAHEASGAAFLEAEAWKETPLGRLTLVGKIDRIDRLADGSALVIDYKTEARNTTAQRIKQSLEDTQLAFYAALLTDDTLAAAYVNVGEKDGTRSYVQPGIVGLRDQLLEGIAADMARIAGGAPMPALGEGKACEFCAARGLCRKDFWEMM
jgi:ATP-dependent helicase/nuclease subunit B